MTDVQGPTGRVVRALWLLLATLDACLLVYLTLSYRWFAHEVPDASSTTAAIIVYTIAYGAIALAMAFEISLVAAIGAGITRQFRPEMASSRWLMSVAAIPAIALLITLFVWGLHVLPLAAIRHTARVDRFEVFERFVKPAGGGWRPLGLAASEGISVGLYLGVLLAVAYLAEKYCLAWLRRRWPVPLVPIAMVASLAWVIATGERVQREFVATRAWQTVGQAQTYPESLEACAAIGSGWTLPRPSELQLYLSTQPDAVRNWTGVAWTNTAAESGRTRAVVVELAPRKSGVWRRPQSGVWQRQEEVNRSVSACEIDTREHRPADAFTRQQTWLCQATPDSPRLHPTTLAIVVLRRGLDAEFGQAGTVCVNRGSQQGTPGLGGRTYADQQEFSTAGEYLASVKAYCASRPWPKELICLTVAADPLLFAENSTERLYRLACDHEGKIEGCAGYASLMERRGEAGLARQYRERAGLFESRRK